ncbi:SGNH/GDSL hydrolase family protein [Nitratidesulfovibrio liaohensis]|uniref:SGNH/GDSL hydrolase family protein n=1 Tax=Nitratidesulfovibrio liaohensis TaxID=2604158 RepID=UPI0014211E37|nr:SGNH/GDSL hydrolase family protein [Nitratidesulfovibrio liaohensis]NHZ46707.1 SGNH/GDSL hydrolase family protein [Nitratidesulfovibrio liaohensis]
MKVEFMTDSQLFEIKTIGSIATYSIFVDGKLCNADAITTANGEAVSWIQVKANDGVIRKVRHVEIYGINTALGAIQANTEDTFSSDISSERPLIYQMGDSYTYGTGAAYPTQAYVSSPAINDFYAYSRALGFDGIAEWIGGSGWNSTGGQYPATRVSTRLANINRKPSAIVFALGYNDAAAINSGTNKEKLVTSMIEAVSAAKAAHPNVPIVVVSPATPKGITSNIQTVYDLVKGFCSKNGIELLEVSNAVTNANSVVYTGTDNVHPNGLGHQHRGLEIARYVKMVALSGGSLVPKFTSGYIVNFIERNGFSVEVKSETVQAESLEAAQNIIKSRAEANGSIMIEIV